MLPLPAGEEMEQGAARQAEGAAEVPSAHTAPQQPQVWRRASPPRPLRRLRRRMAPLSHWLLLPGTRCARAALPSVTAEKAAVFGTRRVGFQLPEFYNFIRIPVRRHVAG